MAVWGLRPLVTKLAESTCRVDRLDCDRCVVGVERQRRRLKQLQVCLEGQLSQLKRSLTRSAVIAAVHLDCVRVAARGLPRVKKLGSAFRSGGGFEEGLAGGR